MARARAEPDLDCVVIGGGPAGLSAAIQLARLSRSCTLVDDDAGRSLWSQVTRNHLGFPDGVSAADLRLLGQKQAANHDVELRSGTVDGLRRVRARQPDGPPAFVVRIASSAAPDEDDEAPGLVENRLREQRAGARLGERRTRRQTEIRTRTVILASGVVDAFPAFEGRDECVGVSLFWCIICDGYESRGRHVAVVGDDEEAIETAFGLLHFASRVTLVTGKRRTRARASRLEQLETRGVTVVRGPVMDYRHAGGQISAVVVAQRGSGELRGKRRVVECEMVFVSTPKRPRTELARRLGARAHAAGYLLTDDAGRTSVPGLYAAGDNTAGHSHQVTTAAHLGAKAATAVNWDLYDLVERDLEVAPPLPDV